MKRRTTARDYPRTARLNTLVREILAEQLERIDDERLEFVTLTSVIVDGDLKRAVAFYDHSLGEDAEEAIQAAFGELRTRLQGAVGRQAKLKRTPELRFETDEVVRNAERIERVLKRLDDAGEFEPKPHPELDDPDGAATPEPADGEPTEGGAPGAVGAEQLDR